MAEARATLKNYRQSPRKVRVVADLVRGKKVPEAEILLTYAGKRAALPLQKLLASAVSNAKELSLALDQLFVKEISVDGGKILYRQRPRSRGMANRIRKRTSHVNIVLSDTSASSKK